MYHMCVSVNFQICSPTISSSSQTLNNATLRCEYSVRTKYHPRSVVGITSHQPKNSVWNYPTMVCTTAPLAGCGSHIVSRLSTRMDRTDETHNHDTTINVKRNGQVICSFVIYSEMDIRVLEYVFMWVRNWVPHQHTAHVSQVCCADAKHTTRPANDSESTKPNAVRSHTTRCVRVFPVRLNQTQRRARNREHASIHTGERRDVDNDAVIYKKRGVTCI